MNSSRLNSFLTLILALSIVSSRASDHEGEWVDNWTDLQQDTYLSPKFLQFSGAFLGKRSHPFNLVITMDSLPYLAIKELRKRHASFGENRSSSEAVSDAFTSLKLTVDGKEMTVPIKALSGIYNAKIGRGQTIRMNENDPSLIYMVFHGPDGGETYDVAFIFKNYRFYRRQVWYPFDLSHDPTAIHKSQLEDDETF